MSCHAHTCAVFLLQPVTAACTATHPLLPPLAFAFAFAFAFALGAGANCFITHFAASINQKKRLGREYQLQPQDLPHGVLQVQHV